MKIFVAPIIGLLLLFLAWYLVHSAKYLQWWKLFTGAYLAIIGICLSILPLIVFLQK